MTTAAMSLRSPSTPKPATKPVAARASVTTYEEAKSELAQKKKLAGYARMTRDYDAYVEADQGLASAFKTARASLDDENVGPTLLKAQLDYELHRRRRATRRRRSPVRSRSCS